MWICCYKRITNKNKIVDMKTPNLIERITMETPRFFRTMRKLGAILTAVGIVLTTHVGFTIPTGLVTAGNYLVLAGAITIAIASTAITNDNK